MKLSEAISDYFKNLIEKMYMKLMLLIATQIYKRY